MLSRRPFNRRPGHRHQRPPAGGLRGTYGPDPICWVGEADV